MSQPRKDHSKDERTLRMASMYSQGLTLEKIGQAFGLTQERVVLQALARVSQTHVASALGISEAL